MVLYHGFTGARKSETKEERDWYVNAIREEISTLPKDSVVVQGGAPNVDSIAGEEAEDAGLKVKLFPADWVKFDTLAGPIRNDEMKRYLLQKKEEGHDIFLSAYHRDQSLGRGTRDMVKRSIKAEVPTKVELFQGHHDYEHETVAFIIHDGQNMLVQHRTDDAPTWPGHHGLFGGALEPFEDVETAFFREAEEELQIQPWEINFYRYFIFRTKYETIKMNVYLLDINKTDLNPDDLKSQQREGQGLLFVKIDDILSLKMNDFDKCIFRFTSKKIMPRSSRG